VWALLLLSLVPLRLWITWLQGLVAISAGTRLKQRLFFGALKMDPDSLREKGIGQLLGSVIESEAVENLALSGGFLALVALVELAVSVFVVAAGVGGALQALLLVVWIAVSSTLAWICYRRGRDWTGVRLKMTHDLIESMVGHRTRVAQLPPERWHDGEDEALAEYMKSSRAMDRSTAALLALAPRGWLLIALLSLAPALSRGNDSSAGIAVALGGMLLAYRAFRRLASGAWQLTGAAIAWERVGILYHSAARKESTGALAAEAPAGNGAALEARKVAFQYGPALPEVLHDCSVAVQEGDRLVLEGSSGGGKSTLVSLFAGMREPTAGKILVDGHDRATLGADAWRKRIASAPQFHENHILSETFAFNLLMGRRGAPVLRDFQEAEAICRELGLGELLDRMPAGMLQMVGETGWQLSHGERSRVYIARALLQDARLVILDESFAALDPENLLRAMDCVVRRAPSLLVISHR
jgi:ATP-binding cassette subfamily B protein